MFCFSKSYTIFILTFHLQLFKIAPQKKCTTTKPFCVTENILKKSQNFSDYAKRLRSRFVPLYFFF